MEEACIRRKEYFLNLNLNLNDRPFIEFCKAEIKEIIKKYSELCGEEDLEHLKTYKYEIIEKYAKEFWAEAVKRNRYISIAELEEKKRLLDKTKEGLAAHSTVGIDSDPHLNKTKTSPFSDYLIENSSYSAADMVATINIDTPHGNVSAVLGELQTISYSIYQDKAPVRVLGNMNAKDWVFGSRTIAGSLIFAVFNKHWLTDIYNKIYDTAGMKNFHFICDEIPPFDISISFGNEYGFDSRMALYGVRLMKEGQVMSVSDIYIENTYEFVASDIEMMNSLDKYQTGKSHHTMALISAKKKNIDDAKAQIDKEIKEQEESYDLLAKQPIEVPRDPEDEDKDEGDKKPDDKNEEDKKQEGTTK